MLEGTWPFWALSLYLRIDDYAKAEDVSMIPRPILHERKTTKPAICIAGKHRWTYKGRGLLVCLRCGTLKSETRR